jgi:hypothetical protein
MKRIELPRKGRECGYWNKSTRVFEFMLPFKAGSDGFAFEDDELPIELTAAKKYATEKKLNPSIIQVREIGNQQLINYFELEDVDAFLKKNPEEEFMIYLRKPEMAILICEGGNRNAEFPETEYPEAGSYTRINREDLKKEYVATAQRYLYDPIANGVTKLCIVPLKPEKNSS